VQYAFSALGLVLIVASTHQADVLRTVGVALLLSLPLPVIAVVLVRRGGVFHAIERWAGQLLGPSGSVLQGMDGRQLDADLDALMSRAGLLLRAFVWQLSGYLLGAVETWWALDLLGHPVSLAGALAIEGLTQAVRHAAFFVPAGVGVQDAAVVLLAQMFGVDREVGLSLALVKRMREILFGCTALLSWQVAEVGRRWGWFGDVTAARHQPTRPGHPHPRRLPRTRQSSARVPDADDKVRIFCFHVSSALCLSFRRREKMRFAQIGYAACIRISTTLIAGCAPQDLKPTSEQASSASADSASQPVQANSPNCLPSRRIMFLTTRNMRDFVVHPLWFGAWANPRDTCVVSGSLFNRNPGKSKGGGNEAEACCVSRPDVSPGFRGTLRPA
jgi:hypothetical protein